MSFTPTTTLSTLALNDIKNNTPHLALFTSSPNVGGGGTEVTGGTYERQPITYSAISNASMSNTTALTFAGLPTANITHYAVFSAKTGGTMKGFGALDAPVNIVAGDQIQFAVNQHKISIVGS